MENLNLLIPERMHEVQISYVRPILDKMPTIRSSSEAEKIFRNYIDPMILDHKEHFWIMLLTNSNSVLSISEIGKGEIRGVTVNLKEIFQLAIKMNASGLIICHNHPSGKLEPSDQDKKLTEKVYMISELHSFSLLDHLIITSEGYYSFSDNGELTIHKIPY